MTIGPQSRKPTPEEQNNLPLPKALDDLWDHIEWIEARVGALIQLVWVLVIVLLVIVIVVVVR